jgi:hypothetical protein
LNTAGFNLLRGETSQGPFVQINTNLIPATSDSLTGSSYSYEDGNVQPGVTYYYLLEEIENTGNSNQHGPVVVKANDPSIIELLIAGIIITGTAIFAFFFGRHEKKS